MRLIVHAYAVPGFNSEDSTAAQLKHLRLPSPLVVHHDHGSARHVLVGLVFALVSFLF